MPKTQLLTSYPPCEFCKGDIEASWVGVTVYGSEAAMCEAHKNAIGLESTLVRLVTYETIGKGVREHAIAYLKTQDNRNPAIAVIEKAGGSQWSTIG